MITELKHFDIAGTESAKYKCLLDCTLAVPTYKRSHKIPELLASLLKLEYVPSTVLIIDGSGDCRTLITVRDFCSQNQVPFKLTLIQSPTGLTIQRNVAVDVAEGKYLFFFDDDCEPLGDYFRNIYNVFENNTNVGAVNGLIINEINQKISCKNKLRYWVKLYKPSFEPRKYYKFGTSVPAFTIQKPFSGTREIDIVAGGACAWNLEKLREIGGFSEFFIGYAQGEDLESSLRMRKKYKILWCGDAHCLHLHEGSGRPNLAIKGKMEVYNRHYIWFYLTDDITLSDRLKFWFDIIIINIFFAILQFIKSGFKYKYVQLITGYYNGIFSALFLQRPFVSVRTQFFSLKDSKQ